MNLCLIDDELKAKAVKLEIDYESQINGFNTNKIFEDGIDDSQLYEVFQKLRELKEIDNFSSFVHPVFFINNLDKIIEPDIILLDWDLDGESAADYLKQMYDSIYCEIIILTHYDKEFEIKDFLSSSGLSDIRILQKEEPETVSDILKGFNKKFSFSLNKIIKDSSMKASNDFLISLRNFDINDAKDFLNIEEDSDSLLQFISEKYKALLTDSLAEMVFKLNSYNIADTEDTDDEPEDPVEDDTLKKAELWKFRLYHKPADNYVRKGDVFCVNEREYFFVVTPDCDLCHFPNKTFGFLTVIRLLPPDEVGNIFSELGIENTSKNRGKRIKNGSSLSNPISLYGNPFVFPFIEELPQNCFVFPNCLTNFFINAKGINSEGYLTYEHIHKSIGKPVKRLVNLNEPFKTQIIENIFIKIRGFGSPDYPEDLRKKILTDLRNGVKIDPESN